MATKKPQAPQSADASVVGWVSFLAVSALFLFVSTKAGTRGLGISMVVGSILQHFSGRGIEYGWEGRPPSGTITGWPAALFTAALGVAGLAVAIWPEVAMGFFGWDEE
ncbi:MAG: hypothetical protein JF607_15455 [Burkholderiales bacterium]|jgi:hypothetical protein|nr:hypothetical protein [Burkholderiales bacterium]MBW8892536.1 hypothetical protein [Burkholderiales bacterium]